MTRRESNKIKYILFIVSVLVILIHSLNNETRFERFFANGIGQFAVPTFFLISGFLFFRTVHTLYDIKHKLRRRIRTLLIPYLIWNLIYYALNLLMKPGNGISMIEITEAAFNYKYNPTFWYMYQLILISILTPLLYYGLKNIRYSIILFLILSYFIYFGIDVPYINEDAATYFFVGAVTAKLYSAGKIDIINKKYILPVTLVSVLLYAFNRLLYPYVNNSIHAYHAFILSTVYVRLAFAVFIFYISDLFFNYESVSGFMEHTFFLYAIHYMIVRGMANILEYSETYFLPSSIHTIIEIVFFVVSPIVCVAINYYLSRFLKKNYNKLYIVITGDR